MRKKAKRNRMFLLSDSAKKLHVNFKNKTQSAACNQLDCGIASSIIAANTLCENPHLSGADFWDSVLILVFAV